jgi:RND family efflux transporter MFP subunit
MTALGDYGLPMPSTRQSGKTVVRWLAALAFAATLAAGAAYAWRRFGVAAPDAAPVAPAPRAAASVSNDTVVATGTIRLRTGAEVRVGAQLSGIVTKLNVTVGSHIEKDAVIAEIESRGFGERITQARAQIAADEATVSKLEHQMARTRQLLDEGLIPRQQSDDLADDLKEARAKLEKSRSDLAVVESDRPYLTIRAPIAGTVASVSTQQGETVASSFSAPTFVTIIEDNALELVAMVDETDIGRVSLHDPVTFSTETYPSKELRGTVQRIAPKATIVSGVVNYEVGIAIGGAISLLKPDMTANVVIHARRKSGDRRAS